jgi:steroid delta-isomerase-like uncharacterized protein
MGDAESNKAVVRAIIDEIWNAGRADRIGNLIAASYTIHRDPLDPWDGKTLDHADFKTRLGQTRTAFPDQRFAIEEMLAEGDRVAVRWTCAGTHQGDLPNFPASGRAFRICGMTIYAIAEGKATGHWQALDRIDLMRQIGAVGV